MRTINVDLPTKIILLILVVTVSYFAVFLFLSALFVPQPQSMQEMMRHMMGFHTNIAAINFAAISLALTAGVLVSLLVKTEPVTREVNELEIVKRALSEDEKAILDEIRRAGEITQDSLRFRLGWSKAKLSRILTNLDKMNLIQRERVGKTYNVFLAGKRPKDNETV
jgi:uncharacterized membrane protein